MTGNRSNEASMELHNHVTAWMSIAARIKGLCEAATIHSRFLQGNAKSSHGADKELQKHAEGIKSEVAIFRKNYAVHLSTKVVEALDRFETGVGPQISQNSTGEALLVRTIIVKLAAFESEVTFLLADSEQRIVAASENALKHLQRLIVVDSDYRKKWIQAFSDGEVECEKLGAIHLHWHDIWAFKAHGIGGRTDLVYQDALSDENGQEAPALILTEWKICRSGDGSAEYRQAQKQAESYGEGVLGGAELSSIRYLIVVTSKAITKPKDFRVRDITYRHVNIAVEPDSPSVASKASI